MNRVPVAILGGGLAGLQLRRLLGEAGVETRLVESRPVLGGLCRTIRSGSWEWDIGPHAFYSRHEEVMREYTQLPVEYHAHERRVRVNHRVPGGAVEVGYPFENGLADLPFAQRWRCVRGYLQAYAFGERPFRNLDHWITNGLGDGIAELFMRPYNRKIWSVPIDRISMGLVKNKIEPEPPWKIVRNALKSGTVGRSYQARFLYPKQNGAGAICAAVEAAGSGVIVRNFETARLIRRDGDWEIRSTGGDSFLAGTVVSTIPIPILLACLEDPELQRFEGRFQANDTYIVSVGLNPGKSFSRLGDRHWVFFAGPESFYRLCFMSALDPARPATVVAEITRRPGDESESRLRERVLEDLIRAGIVADRGDVGLVESHVERFTYPLQTVGMEADRARLEESLNAKRVFLLGRSGRWDYVNTDGIFDLVGRFAGDFLRGPR